MKTSNAAATGGRESLGREVLFGAAFLIAAVGAGADWWGNDRAYYAEMAREAHLDRVPFHLVRGDARVPLEELLALDDATRRYVIDGGEPSAILRTFFRENELSHLLDVQRLFAGVKAAAVTAALVMLGAGLAVSRRRVRRAVLVDAALLVLFGAAAALAFEPLFRLFHLVFFPEGNFLFDPARENLVLVYPEAYWLGVTLRLGATVAALAVVIAALTSIPIRSSPVRVLQSKEQVR